MLDFFFVVPMNNFSLSIGSWKYFPFYSLNQIFVSPHTLKTRLLVLGSFEIWILSHQIIASFSASTSQKPTAINKRFFSKVLFRFSTHWNLMDSKTLNYKSKKKHPTVKRIVFQIRRVSYIRLSIDNFQPADGFSMKQLLDFLLGLVTWLDKKRKSSTS